VPWLVEAVSSRVPHEVVEEVEVVLTGGCRAEGKASEEMASSAAMPIRVLISVSSRIGQGPIFEVGGVSVVSSPERF
jgi:hypothetical protein